MFDKSDICSMIIVSRVDKEMDMNYSEAIELLRLTTPKSLEENAKMASNMLKHFVSNIPLRYLVAVQIVIDEAK